MRLRALPSLASSALVLAASALFAASCGGSVLVEDPPAECEDGLTSCDGKCVLLDVDHENCGVCGNFCFEGTCTDGQCVAFQTCPPNLVECGGICVDPSLDPNHCGGCDIQCGSGYCDLGTCVTGECFCGDICQVISLGSGVPQSKFVPTGSFGEQWVPTCVSGSGADVVFSFFAPYDGQYVFDTLGSTIPEAVLEVIDPGCGIHGCNGPGPGSGAVVPANLFAGQHVLAVVDTQGWTGDVQLNINFGGGACATCNDVLTTGEPGDGFCPGSEQLYNEVASCICVEECAMACVDLCNAGELSPECEKCIYDMQFGCGNDLEACLNDV